jgi:rubredoxin
MPKRWRCTVCGYIHEGEGPPEICPLCGASSDKFELLAEEPEQAPSFQAPQAKPVPAPASGLLREMVETFMPHAVAAHFPNALLPTLALFLTLCLLFGLNTLDHGIYLLLGVLAVSAPLTLATGIYSWRRHFDGAKTPIFHRKLILGVCLVLICAEMLLLRYSNPQLLTAASPATWFFVALAAAALGCVTLLGHYGGMLVFGRAEKNRGHFK